MTMTLWLNCGWPGPSSAAIRINRRVVLHSCNTDGPRGSLGGVPVAASAGRKPARAGFGFSRHDGRHAEPEFIEGRLLPIERPLLYGREAIAAQSGLR